MLIFNPSLSLPPWPALLTGLQDESKTAYWGEAKYTGGKDGTPTNWPGVSGRPPLRIPAASFVFFWHSDGSVNDWGWRMKVRVHN